MYSICYKRQQKPWEFAHQGIRFVTKDSENHGNLHVRLFDLLQKTAKTMEIFTSGYSICYKRQRKPWKFAQVLRLKKFLIKERPKKRSLVVNIMDLLQKTAKTMEICPSITVLKSS